MCIIVKPFDGAIEVNKMIFIHLLLPQVPHVPLGESLLELHTRNCIDDTFGATWGNVGSKIHWIPPIGGQEEVRVERLKSISQHPPCFIE